MEVLSLDPYMVIYHDVVSERDIVSIINLSKSGLSRAKTYGADGALKEDPDRTTKGSWLNDEHEVIRKMTQLTQAMTNFALDKSEDFQVMNYGIGGYYGIHFDFLGYSKVRMIP